jgi:RNA polymerase sigma-70 factor (ECF subfamily)
MAIMTIPGRGTCLPHEASVPVRDPSSRVALAVGCRAHDPAWQLLDAGDTASVLRTLMQRHGRSVYGYCRNALQDPALADDVHQSIFLEVLRALPSFERRSSLKTWLFRIAHHRVMDALKRRRVQRRMSACPLTEAIAVRDLAPTPGEALDDRTVRQALRACLRELDPHTRAVLRMRFQDGLSFQQIANVCGERPGALQARVARALTRLRARITTRLEAPARASRGDRSDSNTC